MVEHTRATDDANGWGFDWRGYASALSLGFKIAIAATPALSVARALGLAHGDFDAAVIVITHSNLSALVLSAAIGAFVLLGFVMLFATHRYFRSAHAAAAWRYLVGWQILFAVSVWQNWGEPFRWWLLGSGLGMNILVVYMLRSGKVRVDAPLRSAFRSVATWLLLPPADASSPAPKRSPTRPHILDLLVVPAVLTLAGILGTGLVQGFLFSAPPMWIAFPASEQPLQVSWIGSDNGGTYFLLAGLNPTEDPAHWEPGDPSSIVICESEPVLGAGGLECPLVPTTSTSAGSPSSTPSPSAG